MYQCQTLPWDFWLTYEGYLRNVHPMAGAQWYVEFSGSPLLLPDNPFDYTGKLTRQISGNYSVTVYAKKQLVNGLPEPEDIISVASANGTTPNGTMESVDNSLTPQIEAVKQQIWDTLAVNEEKRWLAKQQEAQAKATAAAATNAALAAALQAEADRLAAVNARDLQTKLAMQAAAAQTAAAAAVKGFLNLFYPLPADWSYNVDQRESANEFRLEAFAFYYGRGGSRGPVPAGSVSLNPQLYGNDPVAIWNTIANKFPKDPGAMPVFMNTQQACRTADGVAFHLLQFDDLGPPPIMLETTFPNVKTPDPNQGYSSGGVAPWDSQPDVVNPVSIPQVDGVLYGEGFTGSTKTSPGNTVEPDGFLDWLNLVLPDPEQVKMVRFDPSLLEPYIVKFESTRQNPGKVSTDTVSIPPLPDAELYQDPLKPNYGEPEVGSGTLPSQQGQGSTFVQKPPSNLASIGANLADLGLDGVGQMLGGASTDFYNMIALQYSKTLLAISKIAAARADLNDLLEIDKPAKVEQFLRDFDASRYAEKPPPPPPPEVKTETKPGAMLWIGLGVLVAIAYIYSRRGQA